MYERAAIDAGLKPPLWVMQKGWGVFAGALGRNADHAHSVPVLLAGLYAPFAIRVASGAWMRCRAAVVPAGIPYALDVGGEVLAVVYLEPSLAAADALAPLVKDASVVAGALIGTRGETAPLRALYEGAAGVSSPPAAFADLLDFARGRARKAIDGRVARVVSRLELAEAQPVRVAEMAAAVGLSASRFQHLFSVEVGVPFRRYRAWQRLRLAIREVVAGSNFTQAAHAAGFADQPHFAHQFRRTFGAPASLILGRPAAP